MTHKSNNETKILPEGQKQMNDSVTAETLQQFCDRWGMPLSWGYRHTRLKGSEQLPHYKPGGGKYVRIIPKEGDAWMMGQRS